MGLNLRKVIVGLSVLVVLLGVYVAYTRLGGTAPLETSAVPRLEPNLVPVSDDRAGQIGDNTTLQVIRDARLLHRNAVGDVDREFGFEELYRPQGKRWQATHPYMTLFQPRFRCSITGDTAQVQTESSLDRMIPNDAVFSGNVVIHIVSTDPNEPGEGFIYLDDVVFTAERSLLSTSGPFRFLSRVAKVDGRGMELLYDEPRARLELFRIQKLGRFLIRSEALSSSFRASDDSGKSRSGASADRRSEDRAEVPPAATTQPAGPAQPVYECVLWKKVQVVTPEDVIRAEDRLSITNILWGGPQTKEPNEAKTAETETGGKPKAEPNESPDPTSPRKETVATDTAPSSALTLESLPESLFDVVITCQGGLVIRPMGVTASDNAAGAGTDNEGSADFHEVDDSLRQKVLAQRIDIDMLAKSGALIGPVQMTFLVDANNLFGAGYGGRKVPVTVTAQNDVRYLYASNQIVLDGNCVAAARSTEPNGVVECKLTAPRLTLDLMEDPNAAQKTVAAGTRTRGPSVALKRAAASGGFTFRITQRSAAATTGDFYLDGTELDYDAQTDNLVATGPGQMNLYNAQEAKDKQDVNSMSLRKPCYAFLRNFDRLTYSQASGRIAAESKSSPLQMDYFPLVNGRKDKHFQIDLGRVEIELAKTADNRMELGTISASQGIAFREGVQQFDGSTLFYDEQKGLMSIRGDAFIPCYLNGVMVDGIEMNVKTGQVRTNVISPSTFRTK